MAAGLALPLDEVLVGQSSHDDRGLEPELDATALEQSRVPNRHRRHRVVIVGSGFGGLSCAKALSRSDVDITLISATPHHLFQPLLYQVATGILSPGDIAPPVREILRREGNVSVLLGTVTGLDLNARTVTSHVGRHARTTTYDSLVVAAGAQTDYGSQIGSVQHVQAMKSIDDALELRGRILGAFELAELASSPAEQERFLTFVIVGAGPTGVELAGQISELARLALRHNFRRIDPSRAKVVLLDAAPWPLPTSGPRLGGKAAAHLRKMGVRVQMAATVSEVGAEGVEVLRSDGSRHRIASSCVIWAAGVKASDLGGLLAAQSDAELDRHGRVKVGPDLLVPGRSNVFVVGDMMSTGRSDAVAQFAIQGGRHVGRLIRARVAGRAHDKPFRYFDKGNMAALSRTSAVAVVGPLRFSGRVAWLLWLGLHLYYLLGVRHRLTTLLHWAFSFVGRRRSERSTTLQQGLARQAGQIPASASALSPSDGATSVR
jgi:NADH dehydrogenase